MADNKKRILIVQPSFYYYHSNTLIKRKSKICLAPGLISPYFASFFPNKECIVELRDEIIHDIDFSIHYDLVAIPFVTGQAFRAYEIADKFRSQGSAVVMGGYHASACPDEVLQHADSVVVGEFEPVAEEFIHDFLGGQLNSLYQSKHAFDMKGMKFPRYELVDWKKYSTPFFTKFPLETSRGCPNNCEFCCINIIHGHKMRFRPIEEVLDNIDRIQCNFKRLKPRYFFVDENMVAYNKRNIKLLESIIPKNIQWSSFFSVESCKYPGFIRLAAKSGCVGAVVGFETTNERNLQSVNKWGNKIEDYYKVASLFQKHNIPVYGTIMAGFLNDNRKTLNDTISFLKKTKIPFTFFYPVYPFPGTKMFKNFRRDNVLKDNEFWLKNHNLYDLINLKGFQEHHTTFEEEFKSMVKKHYSIKRILQRSIGSGRFLRIVIENFGLKELYKKYDSYATV